MLRRHTHGDWATPPEPYSRDRPTAVSVAERLRSEQPGGDIKAAVYAGTQNLYPDMVTAAKSMIMNAPVDKVYFLLNGPQFSEYIPDMVECIDVSEQPWFDCNGPNFYTAWTYMILLKMALSKLFPECDRILMMDVDTIVDRDISELWELDMGDKMFAMVPETEVKHIGAYHNCGVLLENLRVIREEHADDKLIDKLNVRKFTYPEQDAMNRYYKDRILDLDRKYNGSFCCGYADEVYIWHYAGNPIWQNNKYIKGWEYQNKYRRKSWDEVLDAHRKKYG